MFAIIVVLFSFFQNCQKVKFQDGTADLASESPEVAPGTLNTKTPSISPSSLSTSAYLGEISEWLSFTLNNPTENAIQAESLSLQFSNAKTSFKITDFENNFRESNCSDGAKVSVKPKDKCEFKVRFKPSIVGSVEIKIIFEDKTLNYLSEAKVSATSSNKPAVPVQGTCNPSLNNKTITATPTDLTGCTSNGGLFSGLTNDANSYSWICRGTNGGNNANCRATFEPRPVCVPRANHPRSQHVKDYMKVDLNGVEIAGTKRECYDTNAEYPVNGGVNCVADELNPAGCCNRGFIAIGRTCVAKAQLTQNCGPREQCVEAGYCNNGKCQNSGEGGPCKADIQCQSGLTCRNGSCFR